MDTVFFVCRLQILWSLILHDNLFWFPDVIVLHAYPLMYATISAPPQIIHFVKRAAILTRSCMVKGKAIF